MLVATLHGVGPHGADYAAPLFDALGRTKGMPSFRGLALRWWAYPRILAWWSLGVPRVMRRAQQGLDRLAAAVGPTLPAVLVTHSAGCRIAYAWFTERGHASPFAAWVSGGANRAILDGVALPIGFKPAHIPPWVHVYRTGDPLGGPLAEYGAKDMTIPQPFLGAHVGFWEDSRFAGIVAEACRRR